MLLMVRSPFVTGLSLRASFGCGLASSDYTTALTSGNQTGSIQNASSHVSRMVRKHMDLLLYCYVDEGV